MPKSTTSENELIKIKQAVSRLPQGASIEKISAQLDADLSRRTLQRRLAKLVENGELVLEGSKKGSRYRLPEVQFAAEFSGKSHVQATLEVYPPVSQEGEEIKEAVRRPKQRRKPVGYHQDFIKAYQPNKSYYLSKAVREHLLEIGSSPFAVQPAGTYAVRIYNRLLIDLTWNSSRLEGNTYSLLETQRLIEQGEGAQGKQAFETQMILNHKAAIEMLVNGAEEVAFNSYTICNLHALLADNLLPDPAAGGRLREHGVGIGGSVYEALEGGTLIKDFFNKLLSKANRIKDPFEQAFFAMVQLPYLQPFDDVNKRVSRLAANIPLIKNNLSPLSFVDVPEQAYIDGLIGVYELNRTELLGDVFVWAYERSCARYSAIKQSLGEPDAFRMHYREAVAELISQIVSGAMSEPAAVAAIKAYTEKWVPAHDKKKFTEVAETELMHLHEGNIARYRIRLAQFQEWQRNWKK